MRPFYRVSFVHVKTIKQMVTSGDSLFHKSEIWTRKNTSLPKQVTGIPERRHKKRVHFTCKILHRDDVRDLNYTITVRDRHLGDHTSNPFVTLYLIDDSEYSSQGPTRNLPRGPNTVRKKTLVVHS